ncbi:MAG TPA: amidase [bacterium]|nr:amidase [bacterium]
MKTPGSDLADLPIHELAPRIAAGEVSPRELVSACLARIEAADARLHAFVEVYREEALLAAEAAERAIRAGARLGALHGIPIGLKDLLEMEGRVTTFGSSTRAGQRSTVTAAAVERLRAAGMIALGKTHMVEFAMGGWGTNPSMGTPWNPWDANVHRVPGGSSSGSAVAVAAGLVPAAIGSDTGGSVRIPSSFCGLVGLKVTAGRIPNHGVLALSETLDTLGPMTRSVEDAALIFHALNGPDPRDAATQDAARLDPIPALRRGVRGLRLAMMPVSDLEGLQPEVATLYRRAVETLAGLGAHVEEVPPPFDFAGMQRHAGVIIASEGYEALGAFVEDQSLALDPAVRKRLIAGKDFSAADYVAARKHMRAARAQIAEALDDFDALLTPTTPISAIPVAEVDEGALPHSRFTRAANYLGLCGLAVPAGLTPAGLPASLQIIGKPFAEAKVLRIGWAYEQAVAPLPRLDRAAWFAS